MRELTQIEIELMNRLAKIENTDEFVCGVTQDCYNDRGRKKLLDYLDETGESHPGMIILVAIEFGREEKKLEQNKHISK